MSTLTKKLHILKAGGTEETCSIYTTPEEVGGSPYLTLNVDGQKGYVKLGNTTDAKATHLRVKKDNITYAAWANSIVLKPQVYVAHGSSPWFYGAWTDKTRVVNVDESVSGQATVTCNGEVTNIDEMFNNCSNLTSIDLSNFDTSNVTDMYAMFSGCTNLTSLDLSNFDTSNIRIMIGMFLNCACLTTLDLSSFNVHNVTHMSYMFTMCKSLTSLDLSNFDTSNVEDMDSMFENCRSLTTIDGVIDMKSCTKYDAMFTNCTKLTGVKIKNPPSDFESKTGLSSSQYTVVS